MSASAELTGTHVKYLMTIHEIARAGQAVSSADVARSLGVSRPSVTRMLRVLSEKGLAEKARNGKICQTPAGEALSCKCEEQIARMIRLLPETGLSLTPTELRRAAMALLGALPERCLF